MSVKAQAVVVVVLLALAGCKQTPQKRVETRQRSVAAVKSAPAGAAPTKLRRAADTKGRGADFTVSPGTRERVRLSTRETPDEIVVAAPATPAGAPGPAPTKQAKVDSGCDGLDAYPWPRSYEQAITDASRGARKPGFSPEVAMIIGPDGRITHLRFTRLSGLDSVDRRALEFVTKQHYKPTVLNGERVAVCSIMVILTHFE